MARHLLEDLRVGGGRSQDPDRWRVEMRFLTQVAGVAVAAMIGVAAVPNDAGANSFGFTPLGAVTFNSGTLTDITAAIDTKDYLDAIINIVGDGIFTGWIDVGDLTGPLFFEIPTGLNPPPADPPGVPTGPFDIVISGFTFTFDRGDLHDLTPTGPDTGALVADYYGTLTVAPAGFPDQLIGGDVVLTQSCDQAIGAGVNCSNTLTTAAVPEPASMAVLGSALLALGGIGLYRRRRNGK
jgi:hypothetical protein